MNIILRDCYYSLHSLVNITLIILKCRDVKAQAGKTDTRTALDRQYGDRASHIGLDRGSHTMSYPHLFTMTTILICQTN